MTWLAVSLASGKWHKKKILRGPCSRAGLGARVQRMQLTAADCADREKDEGNAMALRLCGYCLSSDRGT